MAAEKTPPPAAKPGAAAAAPGAAAPKNKRSKWLLIGLALVVVLAGGGGGAWYFLRSAPGGDAGAKAAPKPEKAKPPIFVSIEAFTVNLQAEGGEHLLQTAFSLKVEDALVEQALKLHMPEIRSRLLLLLSSKKASELISVSGKQQLATQIGAEVNRVLHPGEAANPSASDAPSEKGSEKGADKGHEKVADKAADKAAGKAADKTAEKAAPKSAEKTPEDPPEAPQPAAAKGPVLSVFFTSFIIQ